VAYNSSAADFIWRNWICVYSISGAFFIFFVY
jgi:hypothetical protein